MSRFRTTCRQAAPVLRRWLLILPWAVLIALGISYYMRRSSLDQPLSTAPYSPAPQGLALAPSADPTTPTRADSTASANSQTGALAELERIVTAGDTKAVAAAVQRHKHDVNLRLHLASLSAKKGNADVIRIAFAGLGPQLNPVQQKFLANAATSVLHSGDWAKIREVLEVGPILDPNLLTHRIPLALEAGEMAMAEKLYALVGHSLDHAQWAAVLDHCITGRADLDRWLTRFANAPPAVRSPAASTAIVRLAGAMDADATEPPQWVRLLEYCDDNARRYVAQEAVRQRSRFLWNQLVESGMPLDQIPTSMVGKLRAWDLEIWRQYVRGCPERTRMDLWWEDLRSGDLEAIQQWEPLLTEIPKLALRHAVHGNPIDHAVRENQWSLALWLHSYCASPTSTGSNTARDFFVAVITNNTAALPKLLTDPKVILTVRSPPEHETLPPFDAMLYAMEHGSDEFFNRLAKAAVKVADPRYALPWIHAAIEHRRWPRLRAMIEAGMDVPSEELAKISREYPEAIAHVFPTSGLRAVEWRRRPLPHLLLAAAQEADQERLGGYLLQLREAGFDYRAGSPEPLSLEDLFRKVQQDATGVTPEQVVDAAVASPKVLARLQAEGFPITHRTLEKARQIGNQASVEICLRSQLASTH